MGAEFEWARMTALKFPTINGRALLLRSPPT